ncbi:MAG: prepilin-type N-terminal cleavage/methylation domain-containing protein [Acutalibacteraceae bacterium]|nr:prepilin-type N-terminal cleavage/methylation domain-containing protein [Acutalibacteraceae bacterium]
MLYKYLNSKKGFTMVEILVVVLVMGILVGVAVPVFGSAIKKQRLDDCRNQCLTIETAVKQAMNGMVDNGKKQEKISFKCSKVSGSAIVASTQSIAKVGPNGENCFILTNDPATCFTLAELRGGYRVGTFAEFDTQGLDAYKRGCDNGQYLKKLKYQYDEDDATFRGTPFYEFLSLDENGDIPVCPFADEDNTQGYYYYVLEDGSVHCSNTECNQNH